MKQLEFLTQYEVEMTTTGTAATEYFIETVSPVDTHHTNHRKEDTYTDTGRTFKSNGLNLLISFHALPASKKPNT